MRRIIILLFFLVPSYLLVAQGEIEALRYSYTTHGGTARYVGMGGAFGALGGDFSSLSTNPAGLGTFKTSRFMFSPVFRMNTAESEYLNEKTPNEVTSLNVNNFGLGFVLKPYDSDAIGWRSVAFGIGYNKLRNFNNEYIIRGFNNRSSYLDQIMLKSDNWAVDDLSDIEYMAYDTYLTDIIPNSNNLYSHPYLNKYYINQDKRITAKGGLGEYVFSLGGNFEDKLYVGASFGITNIRYVENTKYTEYSDSTDLESFTFSENITTEGGGFNFKFGFIYRPVNFIRIGAAFHTPTFYTVRDLYSYRMESYWRSPDADGYYDYASETDGELEYSYELYTPMRVVTSAAFVLSKFLILSADYEYVNYGRARLRAEDYDFEVENDVIKEVYQAGHNIRFGGEIRLGGVYLRAGSAYYSSPFADITEFNQAIKKVSLGAGIRSGRTFLNVGYQHSFYDKNLQLYNYGDGIENSNIKTTEDNIVISLEYYF